MRRLLFLISVVLFVACSDDSESVNKQEYSKPSAIASGVWTNCLDYDDNTDYGVLMKVNGTAVEFTLFDFEKGNTAYFPGNMVYDNTTGIGTLEIPQRIFEYGKSTFRMLTDSIMECIPESNPEDTIHFMWVDNNCDDWWNDENSNSVIADVTDGPFETYDFPTSFVLDSDSTAETRGVLDVLKGIKTVVQMIYYTFKLGTDVADYVNRKKGDGKDDRYKAIQDEMKQCINISKRVDDNINSLQKQLVDMNNNLSNRLNALENQYKETKYRDAISQQKRDLGETSKMLNERDAMVNTLHTRAIGYVDSVMYILNNEPDETRCVKLYEYLNQWAAPLSNENYVQKTIAYIHKLWNVYFEGQTGYPYIYDQYVYNMKAWEHEGYEDRALLRVTDLASAYEYAWLSLIYLQSCIATGNTVYGAKPQPLLAELEKECLSLAEEYQKSQINERNDVRVCQIVGSHFISEKTLHINDYLSGTWYRTNSPWNPEILAYGFDGDYNKTKKQLLTADEAECILSYYKKITDKSLYFILRDYGQFEAPVVKDSWQSHNIILKGNARCLEYGYEKCEIYYEPFARDKRDDHTNMGIVRHINLNEIGGNDYLGTVSHKGGRFNYWDGDFYYYFAWFKINSRNE
ncbi:MAG: hypothetical protein Q4F34_01245 [Prevotellaceae bacterium]|nr:hypothetical protein [Prevotellaceae bacterium]